MPHFNVYAPTRVDLAGGTLDLWPLYCVTEGAKTINLALDLYAEARVEFSNAKQMTVELKSPTGESCTLEKPLNVAQCRKLAPILRYPAYVISSYLTVSPGLPARKIQLTWRTQVPVGSGLGGSSALGVALLKAISKVFDDYQEDGWRWRLMSRIRDVEATFMETPTGTQDYLAALFGGLSCFHSRAGEISHFAYRDSVFKGLADRLLVIFSGEQHHSGRSNWEVFKGAIEKDATVSRGLTAIRDLTEKVDATLRAPQTDWKALGRLLSEEWRLRRDLFGVSTPKLEALLARLAKEPGLLGAKVCGAASGGSLLALVEPDKRDALAGKLTQEGLQILPTQPSTQGVHTA